MSSSVDNHVNLLIQRVLHLLTRMRFTLLMALLLMGVAVWSDTHVGPLDPDLRRLFGFAPKHLPAVHLHRLVTSAFFTSGGTAFYQTLAMLAGCVGCCEWLVGTRKTALVFWGVHLATLAAILTPAALAAASLGQVWAQLLVRAADVGPSAGYYACLGVVVWHVPLGRRRLFGAALLAFLALRLASSIVTLPDHGCQLAADMAHLIAFPIGLILGPCSVRGSVAGTEPPAK